MKSILQSIKPQYCELIANGKKTTEVRKTRPKLDVPFKVYIYCTKGKLALLRDDKKYNFDYWDFAEFHQSNGMKVLGGKVIGEYVCDRIEPKYCANGIATYYENEQGTCLSDAELQMYADGVKPLYFWHISDLKIYDKPKELSEFYHYCGDDPKCENCPYLYVESNENIGTYEQCCSNNEGCKPLTRPPQSWCYVEEVGA